MPGKRRRRTASSSSAARLHREWLELVDTDGPFLAAPALKRVWPNGMPPLADDRKSALLDARKDFESAWERLDRNPDSDSTLAGYRIERDKWVETVLRDVAGWAESLQWGEVAGVQAQSPNQTVTVTAQAALSGEEGIGAIVHVVDPVDSLRQTPNDLWAATPVDRCEAMLREAKIPIGVVTDGRWWGLVCAREGSMAASGIVDALTWIEEDRTRDAFFAVIGRQHIIGGDPAERLPVLFEESVAAAEEITEALGDQVRQAVELLIQSFSESAADARRRSLPNPLPERPHESYEAAVTVMMRVVFLLFAEERGLLPSGELFEQGYGISRELARLAARETNESEEALDSTSLTWHRLLATSQALFHGASFENLRMPAYGGSLFDPARFPFLTAKNEHGTLAVTVSDRVMLHVLRAVQRADISGDFRQVSFRDIDVEQIGYIYEGLLGYTCAVVDETYLGLKGKKGIEPEIPLTKLEELAEVNPDPKKFAAAIIAWAKENQPAAKPTTETALAKAIKAKVEPEVVSALNHAVGDNAELKARIEPWLGIIRTDLRKRPFVVLEDGLLVEETPSRKNAGAHYTPRSLAEEVVLHALQPLCYSPGPHQTADHSQWKLKSSDEILDLKVADIACGSGAFLVAAARYLADRVAEAWVREDETNKHRKDLHLRAMREVVANCIYGADINDMAVEMCKLSLWLVSLDRSKPFSFVDDKIFCGNSLLGVTSLDQLRRLHIYPERKPRYLQPYIDVDAVLTEATRLRRDLASPVDEDDPQRSSAAKQRLLRDASATTAKLRLLADGVVATGLPLGGKPGTQLDDAYKLLEGRAAVAFADDGVDPDQSKLSEIISIGLRPDVATDYQRWIPIHWPIQVPDVFEHGGFDAVVGNPPFLVSKKISGAIGVPVREWIVEQVAEGRRGGADLVAYFVLRAVQLLSRGGCIGLITSKVIAEGDTREVCLGPLLKNGLSLTVAKSSEPWPATKVAVRYSMLCGTCEDVTAGDAILDGHPVPGITSQLTARRRVDGSPVSLPSNVGRMQKGAFILGSAFVLDAADATEMIERNPSNRHVIRPFMSGQDINSNPNSSPSRFVIDFRDWSRERASEYAEPYEIIETRVRPERAKDKIKSRREIWWQFAVRAAAIHQAFESAGAAVVVAVVSKYGMPVRIPAGCIVSSAAAICPDPSYARLAEMSSSCHNIWAWQWGSTMKSDLRYNPSDVFDTYPFLGYSDKLEHLGRELDSKRRAAMNGRELGLTKFYNLVNNSDLHGSADADVAAVRNLHREIDEFIVKAYGWDDIPLDHGFHTYRQMERFTVSPAARVEILDRLLEENHRRAGLGVGNRTDNDSQGSLFDEE